MKKKLYLLLAFAVLGIVQAAIFMCAYGDRLEAYSFAQCLLALIYAVPQSVMVASWVMLPAVVLGFVYVWIRGDWHRRFMIWYVTLVFVPLLLLCCIDWVLYGFWGFRLDTTPFIYVLDDPLEAASLTPWWAFLLTALVIAVVAWVVYHVMCYLYPPRRSGSITRMNTGAAQTREGMLNLLLAIAVGIVANGCFGLMGISSAYHTDQQPLNHAATSPVYSFFHSVRQQQTPLGEQYRLLPDDECQQALAELHDLARQTAEAQRLDSVAGPAMAQLRDTLRTLIAPRPNVLLLVFESFSGEACQYLCPTAEADYMPSVSRAMAEGIAFTQCYANSFRTERGLVSLLSAFPGQPTYSLMTDSPHCHGLGYLTHPLQQAGYSLRYLYGGDGEFCGIEDYLATAGFTQVIDRRSFPRDDWDASFGHHDATMYRLLVDSLRAEALQSSDTTRQEPPQPFFWVMPTLSCHEPFSVPMQRHDDPYLNAVAYADSCLGDFLDTLRADTLLWRNLLVVGIPDHCYANYPQGVQQHDPARYRIPMFWTGGAVAGHLDVDTYCQQTDLAATLLHRLGLSSEGLSFSHDVFQDDAPHFAFYAWPDGFGLLTDSCRYIQDNHYDGHPLPGSQDPTGRAERLGKAYLQSIYDQMAGL